MNLQPIADRLMQNRPAGVRKIGGAADLSRIKAGQVVAPALYLIPMDESAGSMDFAGDTLQRVEAGFAVVLVVSNKSDATGGAAVDDVEPLREAVKLALHGWSPGDLFERISFTRGALLSFDDGLVFWMDEFTTSYWRR
jgi:hypothetical protein